MLRVLMLPSIATLLLIYYTAFYNKEKKSLKFYLKYYVALLLLEVIFLTPLLQAPLF